MTMDFIAKLPDRDARRRRRRRLKSLSFLPTMMTLGNLLCGFAAIHFALRSMLALAEGVSATPLSLPPLLLERTLPSFLSLGAGLVLCGLLFDLLDGLLARVTRSTTDFGGQLDSLADVVTFGVAPATLMVAFMTQQLAADAILPSPISEHFVGRVAWVSAALYVAFTAVRLARFNVEHAKADFDYRTFHGFPSPGAAAVMVTLLLVQDQLGGLTRSAMVYVMPPTAVIVGFLMVSRIPYRRFHRTYLLSKRPFSQFVLFVLVLAVFWSHKAVTLLLLVLWYAASGPVFYLHKLFRGRATGGEPRAEADSDARRRPA